MAKTVVGLFDDPAEAQTVVQDLVGSGFARGDIGVIANNADNRFSDGSVAGDTSYHHGGESAAKGAGTGAVVGGIAGLLVGLGAFAIPGIGPIVAAGPIAATLAGAGVGAVAGGLIGALTNIGVPEDEAHYYAEGVRRGGTLVTVKTDDTSADRAADIFHRHDAVDIDERSNHYRTNGYTGYDPGARPLAGEDLAAERGRWTDTPTDTILERDALPAVTGQTGVGALNINAGETTIPVVEEDLTVGKRQVERGGVRVYTHVTERPVEENVTLHEEHVTVDRRPADRPVVGGVDNTAFREGVIELTETAEEAVVSKQARVVEEVTINKNATDRTETVRDTVRRQDVEIEELNDGATLDEDADLTRRSDIGVGRNR